MSTIATALRGQQSRGKRLETAARPEAAAAKSALLEVIHEVRSSIALPSWVLPQNSQILCDNNLRECSPPRLSPECLHDGRRSEGNRLDGSEPKGTTYPPVFEAVRARSRAPSPV
jgi:hypothetical protein